MAYFKVNRTSTLQQAKASENPNKVFFPKDSSAVVLNGKEYGGVTQNELNAALGEIEKDVEDIAGDMETLRGEFNAAQLELGAVQTDPVPTKNSGNHMTSGALYTAFQNVTEKEIELLTTPVVIGPNNLYKLGTRESLNVSFLSGVSGVVNEYMFTFKVDGDEFTLTLPSGVKWVEEPSFEDGYIYEVSVVNGLAIAAGWEDENE